MANNCLVTKLKSVVQNDNLVTPDELVVLLSAGTITPRIKWVNSSTNVCKIVLTGGATFSDNSTEKTFTAGTDYMGEAISINGVNGSKMHIFNKYDLENLMVRANIDAANAEYLQNIQILGSYFEGDIKYIESLCKRFENVNYLAIYGDNNLYGDISCLNDYAYKLNNLVLEHTNLEGDVTTILNNIGDLNNGGLFSIDGSLKLTADLSQVTNDKCLLLLAVGGINLKWATTRSSERKIIAFNGGVFGDALDAMLINQANCQVGYTGHESDARYKTIRVGGNRTSASDSAVSTLKNKGYSVTINGVPL